MATEWYRHTTWTKADEEEFFTRLGRARRDGRAQYLNIQAIELIYTGKPKLLNVAESLLLKILTDFPDNRLEKSQTFNSLGSINRTRGDNEKALQYFKQAVDFEKVYPNVISGALLNFAETVIELGRTEFYNEVEEALVAQAIRDRPIFPFEVYIIGSVLSIIFAIKGDGEKATYYAGIAEGNAVAGRNTLWNPRKSNYGLVES